MSGGIGHSGYGGGMARVREDVAKEVRRILNRAVNACRKRRGSSLNRKQAIHVRLETTGVEVVDLAVSGVTGPLNQCVTEAAWRLNLPSVFAKRGHQLIKVDFDAAVKLRD